jgi:hypothetical protein
MPSTEISKRRCFLKQKYVRDSIISTVLNIHNLFGDLDYRITGLTAVNFYGYAIDTNVFDIAVKSDKAVHAAVKRLSLSSLFVRIWDPYIAWDDRGLYIKIQGDILGEPVTLKEGVKLHSKDLLLKRLSIYSKYDACVLKACAYIALTLDDEKADKYWHEWIRL